MGFGEQEASKKVKPYLDRYTLPCYLLPQPLNALHELSRFRMLAERG